MTKYAEFITSAFIFVDGVQESRRYKQENRIENLLAIRLLSSVPIGLGTMILGKVILTARMMGILEV